MVSLKELSVQYPNFRLEPLSLEFSAGEKVALVGANGAGKSTTLKAIAGRSREYEGAVEIRGREVRSQLPEIRTKIGFLPERLLGFGWMSVEEHLAFLSNFFPTWDHGYARDLLRRLDLPSGSKVGTLSKGMAVKLSLIAAEASRPPILILDEPTSGIDPLMRGELLEVVNEAVPDGHDRLVLFSSHILEDIEQVSDRVVMLRQGKLVGDTTIADLRARDPESSVSQLLYSALASDEPTSPA